MEAYKSLLELSKPVSDFYENVYAPVLQTLPWLDKNKTFVTTTEKVLSNIAFPSPESSSYMQNSESKTKETLAKRESELKTTYDKMQADIRVVLKSAGIKTDDWAALTAIVSQIKKLKHHQLLSRDIHAAIHKHFNSENEAGANAVNLLAKLIAVEIREMIKNGKRNGEIVYKFGTEGYWIDSHFVDNLRFSHVRK